ncbi:hypothetical protein Tsubulata_026738 [Turnera subulata]|uniref:Pentacotripeptide-repeat region of PRORP domain-containing protein n=1 Tax=Turnera subulata TaxID=218843 RepID=A0A9Q0G1E1_9ROSI|nr:hypothetical protein Tsubulata_026738 [Turnera subulata]
MVLIAMADWQMGISCFEPTGNLAWQMGISSSSSGFLIPGVSPRWKNSRKKRLAGLTVKALANEGSGNRVAGGGRIVEEEFDFVPSFDHYLKAMESVKTSRDKKPSTDPSRFLSKIGDSRRSKDVVESVELVETGGPEDNSIANVEKRGTSGELGGRESEPNEDVKRRKVRDGPKFNNRAGRMKPEVKEPNGGRSKSVIRSRQEWNGVSGGVKASANTMSRHSPQMVEKKGKAFDRARVGFRGNRRSDTPMMSDSDVSTSTEKRIVKRDGTMRPRNPASLDTTEDGDLQVERTAFQSFEDFSKNLKPSRRETEDRIQRLANWLNGAPIDMPEWLFSKAMRSARIKYTDHSILRVIQLLGKLGNWKRVLQVIEWLQMRERYKAHRLRNVYTTALYVLGKAGRPVEALNLFRVMQQSTSLYPDIIAYHSIAVTLGQAGHMKELFDVIDSMRSLPKKLKSGAVGKGDPRLEPDTVVYNAVLNACVRRQQWEGALWVLQQMKQQGQQPSSATYGLMMEVMLVCGKYNLVHEFFRKLQKSSIPNALVYKVLVNAYWKEGKTEEAVSAVREMERRGIVGSAALYYDLARCLCSSGRCEEALTQIEKICKVANKPLVVTYTGLIQACLDSGNIQNAVYIINQMKHFCSPNLVTCNIMLKAFLDHGLFEKGKELFHKMLNDGNCISSTSDYKFRVLPDIYTFNTMLDACIAEKRWDDFEYVYGRMLHQGYHFNAKRHLRMVLDASRAGKGEVVERTWEHLARVGRAHPPPLVKERFCMMLEKDEVESALGCIATNPMMQSQAPAFSKTLWLKLLKGNAHRFGKDSLLNLMQKLNNLISACTSPSPLLQNLLTACNDFLGTEVQDLEPNATEIVCSGEVVERTWEHLARVGRAHPPPLVKERFCMMLEKDEVESALGCIATNPMMQSQAPAFSKTLWLKLLKGNAHRFGKDSLLNLMQKLNNLISACTSPSPLLQNLLTACNDFLGTEVQDLEPNATEIVCSVRTLEYS